MRPQLNDFEYKLRPGMVTLTWTSMNIESYIQNISNSVVKLEQLILNVNDIIENRIENNIKLISRVVLVDLPVDSKPLSLESFVLRQKDSTNRRTKQLKCKNVEIERAVDDLIDTIRSYQLDRHVDEVSDSVANEVKKYYNWAMYQALLHATKMSLNKMKDRVCGKKKKKGSVEADQKPFFEVGISLNAGEITLSPLIDEIQEAIDKAALAMLKCSKDVYNWGQSHIEEEERESFYKMIARDKEIVKVILLLTGSIQGTKNEVETRKEQIKVWEKYYKKDPDEVVQKFEKDTNPGMKEYEKKLLEF